MDGAVARPEFSNSTHHLDALPNPIEDKWGFIVVVMVTKNTMESITDLK